MFDPGIPKTDINGNELDSLSNHTLQRVPIYQLANNTVSAADLNNNELARLIFNVMLKMT